MISGFNTEFKCRGKVYHVQTEDNGLSNPNIITLLYHQGAIMASRKTSYAEQLSLPNRDEVVGKLMKDQHKKMIKDVLAGVIGLDTAAGEQAPVGAAAEEAAEQEAAAAVEAAVRGQREEHAPAATQPPQRPAQPSPPPPPRATGPAPSAGAPKGLDQMILDYLARELEQGKGR